MQCNAVAVHVTMELNSLKKGWFVMNGQLCCSSADYYNDVVVRSSSRPIRIHHLRLRWWRRPPQKLFLNRRNSAIRAVLHIRSVSPSNSAANAVPDDFTSQSKIKSLIIHHLIIKAMPLLSPFSFSLSLSPIGAQNFLFHSILFSTDRQLLILLMCRNRIIKENNNATMQ